MSRNKFWEIPPIQCNEPDDGVFYAQLGPTGGKQGYSAITGMCFLTARKSIVHKIYDLFSVDLGHVGWGISWYINGLLIPEINVVRGKTYTFVVEGGHDPDVAAKYHPFYITDDSVGGYEYKSEEEKAVCAKLIANLNCFIQLQQLEQHPSTWSYFYFTERSNIRRC